MAQAACAPGLGLSSRHNGAPRDGAPASHDHPVSASTDLAKVMAKAWTATSTGAYRIPNGPPGPSPKWPGTKRPGTMRPDGFFVSGRVGRRAALAAQTRPDSLFFGPCRAGGTNGPTGCDRADGPRRANTRIGGGGGGVGGMCDQAGGRRAPGSRTTHRRRAPGRAGGVAHS
jgi:hypothetical protein